MTTTANAKMTAIPQTALFSMGEGKSYYLVRFTREDPEKIFSHREVKDCLKEAGHIPANVQGVDDEILNHPRLTNHSGLIGLFGSFSNDPGDLENIAFFDLKKKCFWRYDQDASNGGLPHPVLCCK